MLEFLLSIAASNGSIPRLALPSVMSMIDFSHLLIHEKLKLARSIASPIFVPESHGRSCLIRYGDIFFTMFLIPEISLEKGIDTNGCPAKIINPILSLVRFEIKSVITDFAVSILFGDISSASIESDISNIIIILLDTALSVVFVYV